MNHQMGSEGIDQTVRSDLACAVHHTPQTSFSYDATHFVNNILSPGIVDQFEEKERQNWPLNVNKCINYIVIRFI